MTDNLMQKAREIVAEQCISFGSELYHEAIAVACAALQSERSSREAEIERLRDCLRERPNTLLIAHENGDHERLTRATAKAIDRAEAAEAREAELRKALEPFDLDAFDLADSVPDDCPLVNVRGGSPITAGHFRALRRAASLAPTKEPTDAA